MNSLPLLGMAGAGRGTKELLRGERAAASDGPKLLPRLSSSTTSRVVESATAPVGKGGATLLSSSLQSHASRPGSWLKPFSRGSDNVANTAAGRAIVENLLESGTMSRATHPVHGNVVRMRNAEGGGIMLKESGEFIGFFERYTKR